MELNSNVDTAFGFNDLLSGFLAENHDNQDSVAILEVLVNFLSDKRRKGVFKEDSNEAKWITYTRNDPKDFYPFNCFKWMQPEEQGQEGRYVTGKLWKEDEAPPTTVLKVRGEMDITWTDLFRVQDGMVKRLNGGKPLDATNARQFYGKLCKVLTPWARACAAERDVNNVLFMPSEVQVTKEILARATTKVMPLRKGMNYPDVIAHHIGETQLGTVTLYLKALGKQEGGGYNAEATIRRFASTLDKEVAARVINEETRARKGRGGKKQETTLRVHTNTPMVIGLLGCQLETGKVKNIYKSTPPAYDFFKKAPSGKATLFSTFDGKKVRPIRKQLRTDGFMKVWEACHTGTIWLMQDLARMVGDDWVRKRELDFDEVPKVGRKSRAKVEAMVEGRSGESEGDRGQLAGYNFGERGVSEAHFMSALEKFQRMGEDETDEGSFEKRALERRAGWTSKLTLKRRDGSKREFVVPDRPRFFGTILDGEDTQYAKGEKRKESRDGIPEAAGVGNEDEEMPEASQAQTPKDVPSAQVLMRMGNQRVFAAAGTLADEKKSANFLLWMKEVDKVEETVDSILDTTVEDEEGREAFEALKSDLQARLSRMRNIPFWPWVKIIEILERTKSAFDFFLEPAVSFVGFEENFTMHKAGVDYLASLKG